MTLSTRYMRRLINQFTGHATISPLSGGGAILSFDHCSFQLKEYAVWGARTYIVEYTFYGRDWILRLIDSPNAGRRLLQIVGESGNVEGIEPELRSFRL